jgi:hypothetical protein
VLPLKDRLYWYKRFWIYLPAVLPTEMATHWKAVEKRNPLRLECRRSVLAWLWRMRCGLDTTFHDHYTSICKQISTYSSDCGTSRNAVTCRKKRVKHTRRKERK